MPLVATADKVGGLSAIHVSEAGLLKDRIIFDKSLIDNQPGPGDFTGDSITIPLNLPAGAS